MVEFKRDNFKKLKIWQMGMELSKTILNMTESFLDTEKFRLISLMNRFSISIPLNIAEGSSRTDKSFRHFIDIAFGSSFELYTQILLANHKNTSQMKSQAK